MFSERFHYLAIVENFRTEYADKQRHPRLESAEHIIVAHHHFSYRLHDARGTDDRHLVNRPCLDDVPECKERWGVPHVFAPCECNELVRIRYGCRIGLHGRMVLPYGDNGIDKPPFDCIVYYCGNRTTALLFGYGYCRTCCHGTFHGPQSVFVLVCFHSWAAADTRAAADIVLFIFAVYRRNKRIFLEVYCFHWADRGTDAASRTQVGIPDQVP